MILIYHVPFPEVDAIKHSVQAHFNKGEIMGASRFLLLILVIILPNISQAGWLDTVKDAGKQHLESNTSSTSSSSNLTSSEAIAGLKAALDKAVDTSIAMLGKTDGFLTNDMVRIPMPDSLGKVETALRFAGQSKMADQFVTSMNRAAEQAVPLTKETFTEAIKRMTFEDAMGILKGDETAATDYFQRTMTPDLKLKVEPVVSEATDSVNVTKYYKNMTEAVALTGSTSDAIDLDGYVTDKTLEGLFYIMGEEEKNIRKNPLARTSDILKKVFGSM